jgi:hypothetical protein
LVVAQRHVVVESRSILECAMELGVSQIHMGMGPTKLNHAMIIYVYGHRGPALDLATNIVVMELRRIPGYVKELGVL